MPTVFNALCVFIVLSVPLLAMEIKNSNDKNIKEPNPLLAKALEGKTEKISIDEEKPEKKDQLLLNFAESVIRGNLLDIQLYIKRYGFPNNKTLNEIERIIKPKYDAFFEDQLEKQKSSSDELVESRIVYDYAWEQNNNDSNSKHDVQKRSSEDKGSKRNSENKFIKVDFESSKNKTQRKGSKTTDLFTSSDEKQSLKKTRSGDISFDIANIGPKKNEQNTFTDSSSTDENFWQKNSDGQGSRPKTKSQRIKLLNSVESPKVLSKIISTRSPLRAGSGDEQQRENPNEPTTQSPRSKHKKLRIKIKKENPEFLPSARIVSPSDPKGKSKNPLFREKYTKRKKNDAKDKSDDPKKVFLKKKASITDLTSTFIGNDSNVDVTLIESPSMTSFERSSLKQQRILKKKTSFYDYSKKTEEEPRRLERKPSKINNLLLFSKAATENAEKNPSVPSNNVPALSLVKNSVRFGVPAEIKDQIRGGLLVAAELDPANLHEKKPVKIDKTHKENILSRLAKKQGQNLLASLLVSENIWEISTNPASKKWIADKGEKNPHLISYPVTQEKIENLIRIWRDHFVFLYAKKTSIPDSILAAMTPMKSSLRKSIEHLTEKWKVDTRAEQNKINRNNEIGQIKHAMFDAVDDMIFEWTLIVGQYPKMLAFKNKSIAVTMMSDSFFRALSRILNIGIHFLSHDIKENSIIEMEQFKEIILPMEAAFKDALKSLGINNPASLARLITQIEKINNSLDIFQNKAKTNIALLGFNSVDFKTFNEFFVPVISEVEGIRDLLISDTLEIKDIASLFNEETQYLFLVEKYRETCVINKSKKILIPKHIIYLLKHSLSQMPNIKGSLENLKNEINAIIDSLKSADAKTMEMKLLKVNSQNSFELKVNARAITNPDLEEQLSEMNKIKNLLIETFKERKLDNEIISEGLNLFLIAGGQAEQKDKMKQIIEINQFKESLFEDVLKGDLLKIEIGLSKAALWHINWLTIVNSEKKTLCAFALENGYTKIKEFIEKYYEKKKIKRERKILERFRDFEIELLQITNQKMTLKKPAILDKNNTEYQDYLMSIAMFKAKKSYIEGELAAIRKTGLTNVSLLPDLESKQEILEDELFEIRKKQVPEENLKIHRQWILDELEFPYHFTLIDDKIFSWEVFKSLATKTNDAIKFETVPPKDIEKFKGTLLYSVIQEEKEFYKSDIPKDKKFELEGVKNWWPYHWESIWRLFDKQALLSTDKFIAKPPYQLENVASFFEAIADGDVAKLNRLIMAGLRFEELRNPQGKTPWQYAYDLELSFLSFALLSQNHWNMFKHVELENYVKSKIEENIKKKAQKTSSKPK